VVRHLRHAGAHTQVLGQLSAVLAAPEPQLQHTALRLTARGWETRPLPAGDESGVIVIALDFGAHEAVVEHSDGQRRRARLAPNRSVGEVTREVLTMVRELAGPVRFDPRPQETPWATPLDDDQDHATYDQGSVATYFAAATRAAMVLAALRAPYRGRSTPVNAWWGGVRPGGQSLLRPAGGPPKDDFINRNAMDAEEVAVGWWPGDARYPHAAFYGYAHPAPPGFSDVQLEPAAARWDPGLGEFVLDWDDVRAAPDPHAAALAFARSVVRHACVACDWDPVLAATVDGVPPPVS
jgi:hypothetical protein